MMVFKRKQIVVLSLVLMLVVAGYLQYSYKKSSVSVDGKDNDKLGEAVYVDNDYSTLSEDKEAAGDKSKSEDKDKKDDKSSKTQSASKEASDFFAQSKLDKEVTRGKNTDSLKSITEDVNASKEAKNNAFDQMTKISDNSDKEMRIETLVKKQGYNDVIALFGDDGSVDIVVESPNLTSAQTAQIYDIVSRQANVEIGKIHIRNIF